MGKKFNQLKEKFESKKNIVRVQKNKDNPYVVINKSCLNDDNLTWAAKGLHSYLLSLPDDWEIYVNELVNHTSAGRDHTYRVVNELLEHGYMEKVQYRCEGKVLGLSYTVFEVSTGEDNTKAKISNITLNDNGEIVDITSIEPNTESTETDKPDTDSTTLLNNNNNKIITELSNDSVVVVSEKETKLLEMYKFYKIEKRVMPQTKTLLKQYIDKFDLDVFEHVFISASEESVKKKYAYMKKVFEELDKKNIKTLVEYEKDNESYKASKSNKTNTTASTSKGSKQIKTRFHNINQSFDKYTQEELNEILKANQAAKETKRLKEESDANNEAKDEVLEITRELIHDCMINDDYFNSLDIKTKVAVKDYIVNNGGFIPLHIQNI